MKLQMSKVKLLIKILNIVQLLALIILIGGRVFMNIDFIGSSVLVDRDFVLTLLIAVVLINLFRGNSDMRLLTTLMGRIKSQEHDIDNINGLNNTLRAQRHDFLNHVQIIYTLLEMEEYVEAKDYMDNLYSEIKQTGKFLKTSHAAINALIRAKMIEAEEKGVIFIFDTNTRLEGMKIEVWEICRIMSNIIDNAIYATLEYPYKSYIRVRIHEKKENLSISVENAGYSIDKKLRNRIFAAGVTTKSDHTDEHGMGLHIVRGITKKYAGIIDVTCENYMTTFLIKFPLKTI